MSSYGRGEFNGFGSGSGYSSGGGSGGDFDRLASSISSNIQKIASNTNKCQRLVDQIGTSHDSHNLTAQIQDYQHSSNELAKTTNTLLRNLSDSLRNAPQNVKKQRELQKNRLTDEFTSILNKVQRVQREAADKEKASVKRARTNSANQSNPFADTDDYGGDSGALVDFGAPKQQSMQAVLEEEDNLAQIQEREQSIKNLESDILDVNQIFKDLGQLVYEQGDMIDSIESNVENAHVHVEQGNTQLQQAATYQSSARKKKIICFVILFVAAIVLVLVIVLPIVLKAKPKSN